VWTCEGGGSGGGASTSFLFSGGGDAAAAIAAEAALGEDADWSQFAVTGTCQVLEKCYLRLLGVPDPALVRPEPVLRLALASLLERYAARAVPYLYACDQLKAIRQDAAVQHIRGPFAVEVYKAHALCVAARAASPSPFAARATSLPPPLTRRLAIENDDPAEFNQCQNQLQTLWKKRSGGGGGGGGGAPAAGDDGDATVRLEFAAYGVLYAAFAGVPADTTAYLARLSRTQLAHPWVRHAVAALSALGAGRWHRFFELQRTAPNYGGGLMRWCAHRLRLASLAALARSVRGALPLAGYLSRSLGFDNPDTCAAFVLACGGVLGEEEGGARFLDCQASTINTALRERSAVDKVSVDVGLQNFLKAAARAEGGEGER
jgi:hypothetical protein